MANEYAVWVAMFTFLTALVGLLSAVLQRQGIARTDRNRIEGKIDDVKNTLNGGLHTVEEVATEVHEVKKKVTGPLQ